MQPRAFDARAEASFVESLRTGVHDADTALPFIVAALLLLVSFLKWRSLRRSERLTYLLVAIAVGLVMIGLVDQFSPKTARGRWDLAAFPAIIVLAHGFAQFR